MINETVLCFTNSEVARTYVDKIRERLPRYTRDHLQGILKALTNVEKRAADESLDFCMKNSLFSALEFDQVLSVFITDIALPLRKQSQIKLLDQNNLEKANQVPQKSNLDDYENIMNQ